MPLSQAGEQQQGLQQANGSAKGLAAGDEPPAGTSNAVDNSRNGSEPINGSAEHQQPMQQQRTAG